MMDDVLDVYMWLIVPGMLSFEKLGNIRGNRPFFQEATAGLEEYRTGGYGRIGV